MNRPLNRILPRVTGSASVWTWIKWSLLAALVVAIAIIARVVQTEIETSRLQAHYLSELTRDVGYTVETGPSDHIRFPANGPYDERLGYSMIPAFQQRLLARGFVVGQQARDSDRMLSLADRGLFLPYDEKDQTGLMLFDSTGAPLFATVFPQRVYADFDTVPPLVANSLMFIEDRYLLDPTQPNRNPAIDWGRFSRALADQAMHVVNHHQARPGGSTLATQIEKFRHSPNGRTATPPEKLRQIASASILAYMNGPQTMLARRTVLVRYLNSVPLAARPHIGEITGIGDGLAAWYGRDFNDVNRILSAPTTGDNVDEQGKTFREVLSLIIAQRAPSYFLNRGYPALQKLTDSYLRLLSGGGVISPALRDAALAAQIERSAPPAAAHVQSFVSRKAVTSARASLLSVLGISDLYQLDQLDLQATSTLDNGVQQAVAQRLAQASTRDGAQAAGLYGFEMLAPKDDPSHLTYSFTLYEHRNGANLLRVQTDSVNEPFDVNRGGRINLGSTAKLRTLITYLQIMSDLHARYAGLSNAQLAQVKPDPIDALSRWALDYLSHTRDHSLQAMLDAAVERKYSASPDVFYTGGGAQVFSNFDKSDNGRIMTLHTAFEHSVNLVFVRLMRDIVHYEMLKAAGPSSSWLDDPEQRQHYLAQFVDSESQVYVKRYYTRYAGKAPDDALALMLQDVRKSPPKIATVLRSVAPNESLAWFDAQMRAQLKGTPAASLSDDDLAALYAKYAIDRFNLNDRGYIASVHPLALWTLNYLRARPDASLADVQRDSHDARFYTYSWLYKTRYHATQDRRIRRMVELRAYGEITKAWRALGYPFANVTPSYAAAIGASGDQPDALAKLIGLIANNGEKAPTETITRLDFAKGTPYETRFVRAAAQPQPTLSPEIVNVSRTLLRDVVLNGTGRRLAGGLTLPDGKTLAVYGKTGTGDQRFNVYARGARLIESRKVNRSGTFVFVLGDRFFGVLTATAHEPYAARYDFTSAMAVQLLKMMAPALAPLIERPADAGTRTTGPAPQAEMPTPQAAPVEPS